MRATWYAHLILDLDSNYVTCSYLLSISTLSKTSTATWKRKLKTTGLNESEISPYKLLGDLNYFSPVQ